MDGLQLPERLGKLPSNPVQVPNRHPKQVLYSLSCRQCNSCLGLITSHHAAKVWQDR